MRVMIHNQPYINCSKNQISYISIPRSQQSLTGSLYFLVSCLFVTEQNMINLYTIYVT